MSVDGVFYDGISESGFIEKGGKVKVIRFENAQVCAGGISTIELSARTMESRYIKGLYLTGELLDADGICGGYNLQWAWATGYLAGKAAADTQ